MMRKTTGEIKISPEILDQIKKSIKSLSDLGKKIKESSFRNTTEVLEIILASLIILEASDVHIEPEEEKTKIRARIDGMLHRVTFIENSLYSALASRIKLISGIKLNIKNRPQDGRFSIDVEEGQTIEIRSSTLPSEHGESIVMRVLNPKNLISIEELGLREDLLQIFNKQAKKPNGMIIITGPTGSGKTTTLYAFLKKAQSPEIKIITIEDPIEYHLSGISQTQTAPEQGYDFASGLKSLMRQDPDIILVGEIRDAETARITIQAALTGHFVLTTLHTNDTAGTIARLITLGASPSNIGPALNMVVAQRLVRKVCQKCGGLKAPSLEEKKKIKKGLAKIPANVKIPKITQIPEVKGCKYCNKSGYRGRVAISEALIMDAKMEKFILTNTSISAFKEEAVKQGMTTVYQDGLIKVLNGITTIEEIERVVGKK
ncbi:type II/IV secretion system protein [Candidatus Parcubacteria bacterium]|nr:type II/IV secretion system protein [Candidatus Parcubacteria bacterium]